MTILITGAAGFIGSHLTDFYLEEGHSVIGIDNYDDFYARSSKEKNLTNAFTSSNFTFIEGDITQAKTFKKISGKPDLVIHLAAKAGVLPSIKNPAAYIETNINGTYELLEYMRHNEITKLLFASSSSVYGNNTDIPFLETHSVDHPISPYAFTKKSCELLIYTYHNLYKLDTICMRFFTVYGPRQRPDLAIRKFIQLIQNNQAIEMYGDGSTARDYTYVADTVHGISKLTDYLIKKNELYEIVNLGNNTPVTLIDLIDTIYAVLDKEKQVIKKPMQAGDVNITFANINKAKSMVGYQPQTTIRDGITKFVSWLVENE